MEIILEEIVDKVKHVSGVDAIVLGGSRAVGDYLPDSDIDIGLYYSRSALIDLATLDRVAAEFDDSGKLGLTTPLGAWGPWINGGAWLCVRSQRVDLLYRDLKRVEEVITACHQGDIQVVYQPGHPHGFVSSIYMGEVALCKSLWDPQGKIMDLKARTAPYPAALQKAIIDKFAWEAEFSLGIVEKGIERADVAYTAGCCYRAVSCLLQVVWALNQAYWLNEKGAVAKAESFPIKPKRFRQRIERAFTLLGGGAGGLCEAVDLLKDITEETLQLVKSNHQTESA